MSDYPGSDSPETVEGALRNLRDEVAAVDGVSATIYEDDSAMTPMLVVEFAPTADRTETLRTLFRAEGLVEVDSVHDTRVVVRGE